MSAAKERRYLLLVEERSSGFGYSSQYYHQRARVVTDRYERGERVPYGISDTYDGPLYSGLHVSCQGDDDSRRKGIEAAVYGIEAEYHDVHRVRLGDAKRMHAMLQSIAKGLEKIERKRGYARSWPEYLGRVAEILGCEGIVCENSARTREVTGVRWRWMTTGEGINYAANLIYQWQRELQEREAAQLPAAAETD